MAKDTLTLKDGTVINLEECSTLSNLKIRSADRHEMLSVWEKMTNDNLQQAQVKNSDGLIIGNYADLALVSETSTVSADGSVLTAFNLRQKTAEEMRLENLEAEQEIQNGAIQELAEAVAGGEEQ